MKMPIKIQRLCDYGHDDLTLMSKWFLRLATESKNWHVRRDQEKWEGE